MCLYGNNFTIHEESCSWIDIYYQLSHIDFLHGSCPKLCRLSLDNQCVCVGLLCTVHSMYVTDDQFRDELFFPIQFNVPFKIISAHMGQANQ